MEEVADPVTGGCSGHGLAVGIEVGGARAVAEQEGGPYTMASRESLIARKYPLARITTAFPETRASSSASR